MKGHDNMKNSIKITYVENNVQKEVVCENISRSKAGRLKRKYLKADDTAKITLLEIVVMYQVNDFLKTEILHSLHD